MSDRTPTSVGEPPLAHDAWISQRFVEALRQISRAIDLRSRLLLQNHGLTAPQLTALQAVARLQPVAAGVIARQIHLGQPTMTGILDRLERAGLVQRSRAERDRRSILIELTPRGREVLQHAPTLLPDAFLRQLARLPTWEQTHLLATLQRVAGMLEGAEPSVSPQPPDASPPGAVVAMDSIPSNSTRDAAAHET